MSALETIPADAISQARRSEIDEMRREHELHFPYLGGGIDQLDRVAPSLADRRMNDCVRLINVYDNARTPMVF